MSYLICAKCDKTQALPTHCGKPMKVQEVDGKKRLVCWMGTTCGVQDLPQHCEVVMGISDSEPR